MTNIHISIEMPQTPKTITPAIAKELNDYSATIAIPAASTYELTEDEEREIVRRSNAMHAGVNCISHEDVIKYINSLL